MSPGEHLEALIAHIQSGTNLNEVAFTEGHITYHQLQRIDQSANPQFYTEVFQLEDVDYQPPCFQDVVAVLVAVPGFLRFRVGFHVHTA